MRAQRLVKKDVFDFSFPTVFYGSRMGNVARTK